MSENENKNIVSIEDRIPKLKQARKKKANRRLIFYLSIFFILVSVIVYLQSPLSNIYHIEVTGNTFVNDEVIAESSELTTDDNMWSIDKAEAETQILENEEIKSVSISRKFPSTIEINVKELGRVGYISLNDQYHALLTNGSIVSRELKSPRSDAPVLYGFSDDMYLEQMAAQLKELPEDILNLISEIHYQPTDDNAYVIRLFMNDGQEVQGTIRTFASNIEAYPSIAAQLDPDVEGILHIGAGTYFEPYETEEDEETEENS